MSSANINKENSVQIFINTIKLGQQKGAFLIQEASILKKAIDYFDKDTKVKPDFGTAENAEKVAVNLLIQGCQKVHSSSNNPLSLDDAATICECFEFWAKLNADEKVEGKPSAKSVAQSLRSVEEEDEEEPVERLITVKGKGRAN